jgi:hypothetical protein
MLSGAEACLYYLANVAGMAAGVGVIWIHNRRTKTAAGNHQRNFKNNIEHRTSI